MKLKPCPFCGGKVAILVCDAEGNTHNDDYENDPWSGLGYELYHSTADDPTGMCPIASPDSDSGMGIWIYDTKEEAIEAWNRRAE